MYLPAYTDASGAPSRRLALHGIVYFVLLFLLACAQPVSNYLMSAAEVLLFANWVLEWDMRRKFSRSNFHALLVAYGVLLLVHLVWLLPSDNWAYGLDDLRKKLPFVAIPLVLLTSRRLSRPQLLTILAGYVLTVFVATVVGRVRYHLMPDLPYRDIIPYISHIRFALNVCFSVVLLGALLLVRLRSRRRGLPPRLFFPRSGVERSWLWDLLLLLLLLSLLQFLLVIRSYTALAVLFVVALVLTVAFRRRIASRSLRAALLVLEVGVALAAAALVGWHVRQYYKPVPLASQPLQELTAAGRPYRHKCDGLMENGNLVNNYVCREELESEWALRSALPLDSLTPNGYAVYPTLVRYLNALGTTKDSVGIQRLSAADVAAIEQGVANPVYVEGSHVRSMVYVMLFEYECYRHFRVVKDFTMLQRFELWRNGWRVFCRHPLFGTGTGDVVDECHAQLQRDASQLAGTAKHAHNQYLTFLISFGAVGFLLIVGAFVWALRRERACRSALFAAYLVIVLVSFLTEDTFETLAGCVFVTYFFCLLPRHQALLNPADPSAEPHE